MSVIVEPIIDTVAPRKSWSKMIDSVHDLPEHAKKDIIIKLSATSNDLLFFQSLMLTDEIDEAKVIEFVSSGRISPNERVSKIPLLIYAIKNNAISLFQYLISLPHIDINVEHDNVTPFLCAIILKSSDYYFDALLTNPHVDVNCLSSKWGTPLMLLCAIVRSDTFTESVRHYRVEKLLQHPKITLNIMLNGERTALWYAVYFKLGYVVQLLLDSEKMSLEMIKKETVHLNLISDALNLTSDITQVFAMHAKVGPAIFINNMAHKFLFKRKLFVRTKHLIRIFCLFANQVPKQIWEWIAKYELFSKICASKTKGIDLSAFAEVALGKADCNIKDILSVGGIWSVQKEELVNRTKMERAVRAKIQELYTLVNQLGENSETAALLENALTTESMLKRAKKRSNKIKD